MTASVATLPRTEGWQARLRLGFAVRGERTVLVDRERHGPLAVQRPFYPEGDICHVYLLHPPGGVVAGDALGISVDVGTGAHAVLTTPGATKFYRSVAGHASQTQRITVQSGATLEWLPQENILFPGADVRLQTDIDLLGDARLCAWEIQCLGRPAIKELFEHGRLDSRLTIQRDGMPLVIDRLRVDADNRARLSLMAGMAVGATLYISNADEQSIERCRDLLLTDGPDYTGATLLEDILVVRYLGNSTERARQMFTAIWQALREQAIGRTPHLPRIWAT